jgi:hypothetical protein
MSAAYIEHRPLASQVQMMQMVSGSRAINSASSESFGSIKARFAQSAVRPLVEWTSQSG